MSDASCSCGAARIADPAAGSRRRRGRPRRGGWVAAIGDGALEAGDAEVIDCAGLIVSPGLVDMHAHFREPGFEHKETVETGTRAAAVGGYTAVAPMAEHRPGRRQRRRRRTRSATWPRRRPLRRVPGRRDHEGPRGRVAGGDRRDGRGGRPDVQRRRAAACRTARLLRNALDYAKAFDDVVIAEHARTTSLAEGGQMHEGLHLRAPRPARAAGRGGGSRRRPRPRHRSIPAAAAPVPPVVGPVRSSWCAARRPRASA